MKKVVSVILFVLSIIAALFDVFVCVYGIIDISDELARIPAHASGSEYLGVAIGVGIYAFGIFVISLFGLIISGINAAITEKKAFKYISIALVSLFVLILMLLPAVATR